MHALMHRLVRQFHRPGGFLGILVGLHMHHRNRARNVMLADLAELQPGDRVLDVGCGPGTAVAMAAERAGVATGVDVSKTMVRLARLLHRKALRAGVASFREAAAEALPFADDTFTVVWSMNSYHHWSDGGGGLREVARVLGPGGRVLICESLPNPARRFGPPGLSESDIADVTAALDTAGFERVSTTRHVAGDEPYVVAHALRPDEAAGQAGGEAEGRAARA